MKVILDLCVVPLGTDLSLSKYVAACHEIIEAAGLKNTLHANGTNIEGEYDAVFRAVKKCHEKVHEMGAPRIHTIIKMGTRIDKNQAMEDKIKSVEDQLKGV